MKALLIAWRILVVVTLPAWVLVAAPIVVLVPFVAWIGRSALHYIRTGDSTGIDP